MSRRSKRAINRERENLISQMLETPEGRYSLSQAMVEPLRRSLDYAGIGRRLLMVDELPQGGYANYTNYINSRREIERNRQIEQITEEENTLNNYLVGTLQNKLIEQIEKSRKDIKNAIFELEI